MKITLCCDGDDTYIPTNRFAKLPTIDDNIRKTINRGFSYGFHGQPCRSFCPVHSRSTINSHEVALNVRVEYTKLTYC